MKFSSLLPGTGEHGISVHHGSTPVSAIIKGWADAMLKQLDRMGSAIALGEAGDLDGAHELRNKFTGG